MKRIFVLLLALCFLVSCAPAQTQSGSAPLLAATTAPVAQFTEAIVEGTGIAVQCVVTEAVSCLHDYTLSVEQMMLLEKADAVIINGLGLEDFLSLPAGKTVIDAATGVEDVIPGDPHIWLDPDNAEDMAETICRELSLRYPQYAGQFAKNLEVLARQFEQLDDYGEKLERLRGAELVTFHDGFRYFADFADVRLLASMEVEPGSEPAAKDLADIVELVRSRKIPAVFVEVNGSAAAAEVVSRETGCRIFTLNTAMSGDYFTAMMQNVDSVWEAFS